MVFVIEPPLAVSVEDGDCERYGAEQHVHRALREHEPLEDFALGFDFDIGRGPRHFDDVIEQIFAALLVEPNLLESVQQVDQALEQPILPVGCFAHPGGDLVALGMEQGGCHADHQDGQHERQQRQIRDVDPDEEDEDDALHQTRACWSPASALRFPW